MKMRTLLEMPVGSTCQIVTCQSPERLGSFRLLEMGLVPGALVRILRKAPLQGALELEVSFARLCVGQALAREFLVVEALSV